MSQVGRGPPKHFSETNKNPALLSLQAHMDDSKDFLSYVKGETYA